MKKLTIILFLITLFLTSCGQYGYLYIEQKDIKSDTKDIK